MSAQESRTPDPRPTSHGGALRPGGGALSDPLAIRLLESLPDPILVIDESRRIVFANRRLEDLLKRPRGSLIGLRPGEALRCVHSCETPGGCGASEACGLCGADIAIARIRFSGKQEVEDFRVLRETEEGVSALDLRLWVTPLDLEDRRYSLVVLHDITDENRRRVLERIFFHDVMNIAGGLHAFLESWPVVGSDEAVELVPMARELMSQMVEEIRAQRDLALAERGELPVTVKELDAARLLERLRLLYSRHPAAVEKKIAPAVISGPTLIRSDEVLLGRVLGNLIKNALEASEIGQTVALGFRQEGRPEFSVHNETAMREDVKLQVFQRSFSTKGERGRGIGTYSIKLLTERYIKGKVSFTSREGEGTTFVVELPETPD